MVIAGPNGAGKTTVAPYLLRDALGIREFVNADTIAAGLSGFAPERASFAAGRLMLGRIHGSPAIRQRPRQRPGSLPATCRSVASCRQFAADADDVRRRARCRRVSGRHLDPVLMEKVLASRPQ
jgi:hypothetical protein